MPTCELAGQQAYHLMQYKQKIYLRNRKILSSFILCMCRLTRGCELADELKVAAENGD